MAKQKRKARRYRFHHSHLTRWWRRYSYKHTSIALVLIVLFVILLDTALVQNALNAVKDLDRLGIVIAGVLFTSFFTAVPATVLLISFLDSYDPLAIALLAGFGSLIGDWIILKIFEEKIAYELTPLARKLRLTKYIRRLHRKKERERTTLLGIVVIASPLPDELGIGLLGMAHLPIVVLLPLIFVLNAIGILLILTFI